MDWKENTETRTLATYSTFFVLHVHHTPSIFSVTHFVLYGYYGIEPKLLLKIQIANRAASQRTAAAAAAAAATLLKENNNDTMLWWCININSILSPSYKIYVPKKRRRRRKK